MAEANEIKFDQRLSRIELSHRKAASGYVRLVERNGVLVPVERVRLRRRTPWRIVMVALAGFLLIKGFLFASVGTITYNQRLMALEDGNAVEQAGAWVMHADPITIWIAGQFRSFL